MISSKDFDFVSGTFRSPHHEFIAREEFCAAVLPPAESARFIEKSCMNPNIKSVIRFGDVEANYLCLADQVLPRDSAHIINHLWWCGIDKSHIPPPSEYAKEIQKADLFLTIYPGNSHARHWGAMYCALKTHGILGKKPLYDLVHIYTMCTSGQLFNLLQGQRIALVGGKVDLFYRYFFSNEHYRRQFPFLELEHVNITAVIPTPDLPDFISNYQDSVIESIRESYKENIEVYLFSCGYLAKQLACMVASESGRRAFDIGNSLELMMGMKSDREHLIGVFKDYQHPEFEILLDPTGMSVIDVKRRTTPLHS